MLERGGKEAEEAWKRGKKGPEKKDFPGRGLLINQDFCQKNLHQHLSHLVT